MKDFALHAVLAEIWAVVGEANRYFATQEALDPAQERPDRMGTVLFVTADVQRAIAVSALPFIPEAAGKLLDLLACRRATAPSRRSTPCGACGRASLSRNLGRSFPVTSRPTASPRRRGEGGSRHPAHG
jgi:methionyl-tRNA synthetase